MSNKLYNPFKGIDFNAPNCFLTGEDLSEETDEQLFVFPEWLMDRYSLRETTFKMLEGSTVRYQDMKVPCVKSIKNGSIADLEAEIEEAFTIGYEAVKELPEDRLFLWMAKLLYGVFYNDVRIEQKRFIAKGKEFSLPLFLQERFGKLHVLMQSLALPVDFSESKLWSIKVFKTKISKDVFNYKDETTNLNFSLSMHDFGIVACLQDNGAIADSQQAITDKFEHKTLHPVQFEEICARYIYANYLLNSFAKYTVQYEAEKIIIVSDPLTTPPNKSLFERWDDDMFAQVLSVYWKPWGITKNEIITFGNSPISYLEDSITYKTIEPESISLQY